MTDSHLAALIDEREAVFRKLVACSKSHRESSPAERRAYGVDARAFCEAEDAILTELRCRPAPFDHRGRRFEASPSGLAIEVIKPGPEGASNASPARKRA